MMNRKIVNPSLLLGTAILFISVNVIADSTNSMMMNSNNPGMMSGMMPGAMMNKQPGYGSGACPNKDRMMPMGQGMMSNSGMMGDGMGMMRSNRGMMGHGRKGNMRTRMDMINMLELSDEQQKKAIEIQRELRKQRWAVMGQIMDEKDKLTDLYDQEIRDPKAIGNVYSNIFNLKKILIEDNLVAGNKARQLLNEEQRKQLSALEKQRGNRQMGGMGNMMQ